MLLASLALLWVVVVALTLGGMLADFVHNGDDVATARLVLLTLMWPLTLVGMILYGIWWILSRACGYDPDAR